MNILHLDTRPDWRGGQHQILLTMRGLRKQGHVTELLAPEGSPLQQRAVREGFPVHAIPRAFLRWRAARSLRRLLASRAFDIVHAHDANALTVAWLAGAQSRVALIAARRVAYPLSRSALGLARYRAARGIIGVSQFVARSVLRSGLDPARVSVVYDGVELPALPTGEERMEARRRWNVSPEEKLLGCVGYLLPEKGQELLIRAWPAVRERVPHARLLLAGDGPCRGKLENLARELNVSSTVIFAGFVDDAGEVYRALDIFLFPSLEEPLGSSLLAAMAHGLPAVAVDSGGVPEIIADGRDGVLVTVPPDKEKFARAILRLLESPAEAARLGAAARETIAARFTADKLVENTLQCYREVLARS